MNGARIAVLGVAVVTAGLAAFLVRNIISDDDRSAEASQSANTLVATRVLVASRDIGLGEKLRPDDMKWLSWPEEGVVSVYISEKKDPNGKKNWDLSFH